MLVPVQVERFDLGGSTRVEYACSGSKTEFNSSTFVLDSRRYIMSLAVLLAFLLIGHTHSGYHWLSQHTCTWSRNLVLHCTTIYDVVKDAYLYIKRVLDKVCSLSLTKMR